MMKFKRKNSSENPCFLRHITIASYMFGAAVPWSSTISRKNVSGETASPTTACMHSTKILVWLCDVDSSSNKENFMLLRKISATILCHISCKMWSIMSAHDILLCNTRRMFSLFSCCRSTSAGRSVNGRSFLAVLYAVLKVYEWVVDERSQCHFQI